MNIGDKITIDPNGVVAMTEINNVVPVQYKDDGDESWYEVCDAEKSKLVAIVGKDIEGNDIMTVINKETCDTSLFLDLL